MAESKKVIATNKIDALLTKWNATVSKEKFTKNEWICFWVTMLTGGFIYYQMPSNWLTNPDGVWNAMYFRNGHGGEKANGRLLQILIDKLRMNMITPVLTTLFCIVLLAFVAILINRIIKNERLMAQLLIGQLLLFMPCTSGSLTYFYCSDSFMLAFLCVVLAVYIVRNYQTWTGYLLGIALVFGSLYLYQAYLCVVFAFAVLLLLVDILAGRNVKDALRAFGSFVITSVSAVVAYVVSFKILQSVLHLNVRADRGFGFDLAAILGDLPSLLGNAYVNFYEYFFGNRLLNNTFGGRWAINAAVLLICVCFICMAAAKQKIWKNLGKSTVVLVCIVAFPIALEAITIMSPDVDKYGATGIIMVPTMVCMYLLAVALGNVVTVPSKRNYLPLLSHGVIMLFVWNSIVFTSLCINSMQLQLHKTETVADMMVEQIVEECGYVPYQKLLVAGSMEDGNFPALYEWPTEAIQGSSASYGFMWDTYTGNECCWILFLKQYKGVQFEEVDYEQYQKILQDAQYQEMPVFPNEGSVKEIDGVVVVKMSTMELE